MILLVLLLTMPIIGFSSDDILFALLIVILPSILVLLSGSVALNKVFLKSIYFNDAEDVVILTAFRYNKKKIIKIDINDIDVRVTQVLMSIHKFYKIQFLGKKDLSLNKENFKNGIRKRLKRLLNILKN
jgi:hypothetical protein